jgi:hypothetical protein
MFDDILRPKRKSIWIEPGVYLTLSCKECGECETSKLYGHVKDVQQENLERRWI